MQKKKTTPLGNRLMMPTRTPKQEAPTGETAGTKAADTAPPKRQPSSVLTPSYIIEQREAEARRNSQQTRRPEPKTGHYAYELTAAAGDRLADVLTEASPFSSPLTAAKLVDLVYCEFMKSEALQERFRAEQGGIAFDRYRVRSTIVLPEQISGYLRDFLQVPVTRALSLFLTWCLTDWGFVRQHLTYRGLRA